MLENFFGFLICVTIICFPSLLFEAAAKKIPSLKNLRFLHIILFPTGVVLFFVVGLIASVYSEGLRCLEQYDSRQGCIEFQQNNLYEYCTDQIRDGQIPEESCESILQEEDFGACTYCPED